jgi:hypothetical protein
MHFILCNYYMKKVEQLVEQAMEACGIVGCGGAHNVYSRLTCDSEVHQTYAPAGHQLPQEDLWYSFLLEAESTQGH